MSHSNIVKGVFITLCIAGFAVIAYFISQGAMLPLDATVQNWVFTLRSDWLTAILVPLTYSGNWQLVTVLCLLLLLCPPTRKHYGLPLTASALISLTFYETLKFIFQRPRPDMSLHLISQGGFSFPSGHTLTSLVFWGTAILLLQMYVRIPRSPYEEHTDFLHTTNRTAVNVITAVIAVYILLMGFSRIYVGVHYPTDVLGSWLLGACILTTLGSYYLSSFKSNKSKL